MRMSDWSSDVCSSDLSVGCLCQSFRKFRRTLALRTEGCRERADLGHARRQDLGRHEEAGRLWAFVYHARQIWRHRSVGITGQVLFQPTSDLKFLLSADYSEINQPSPTQVATNIGPAVGLIAAYNAFAPARGLPLFNQALAATGRFTNSSQRIGYDDATVKGISLTGEYAFATDWNFKSITAYRKSDEIGRAHV